MERLYKVTIVYVLLLLGIVFSASAANDYCSLVVHVVSPERQPQTEVLVSVRETNGRASEKETTSEGASFCDLGVMPVTVTIGGDTCNQVVVRDVPLVWNEQRLLTVVYDYKPCMPERPLMGAPYCQILFRVATPEGLWIKDASIRFPETQLAERQTDAAGRASLLLKANDRVKVSVISSGFKGKSFFISCPPSELFHDEMVRLERSLVQR
jgi:hypothetical protein